MRRHQTREYYYEHPEVMDNFSCSDWLISFDDNFSLSLREQSPAMSSSEFDEFMKFIEERGGKLFAHHDLLTSNKEQMSDVAVNYLYNLNKDLTLSDMKLLELCYDPHWFNILTIDLSKLSESGVSLPRLLDSISKYNVKRVAFHRDNHGEIIEITRALELKGWEIKGTIKAYEEDIFALEFKKVEDQKEEKQNDYSN